MRSLCRGSEVGVKGFEGGGVAVADDLDTTQSAVTQLAQELASRLITTCPIVCPRLALADPKAAKTRHRPAGQRSITATSSASQADTRSFLQGTGCAAITSMPVRWPMSSLTVVRVTVPESPSM